MKKNYDLLCMGRSTLDLFGDEIGTLFEDLQGFRAYVGGSPTNICVAAQRLGLKTVLLTGVGDNFVSGFITKFLQKEGVETAHILNKPGKNTNTVMVALQPPDKMQFVAYGANNADLEMNIDDVLASPVAQCRVFAFNGMGLIQDPSRSAHQFAADYARRHGTKVFMDLDYRVPMWPDARIYTITVQVTLRLVDIAAGTEEEVMQAAGIQNLDEAVALLLELVQEAVIVKRGAKGATVYTRDGQVFNVAPFVVEVVNFLGAGDAFAGGFIYALLQGMDYATAARFGNACGAMIVTRHGTANDMPILDEVQAFIEAHGGL